MSKLSDADIRKLIDCIENLNVAIKAHNQIIKSHQERLAALEDERAPKAT